VTVIPGWGRLGIMLAMPFGMMYAWKRLEPTDEERRDIVDNVVIAGCVAAVAIPLYELGAPRLLAVPLSVVVGYPLSLVLTERADTTE